MMRLGKEYIPLVLFKGNITELPKSHTLVRNTLFAYIALELLIWANIQGAIEAFIDTFIECLLTFLFIAVLLFLTKSLNLFIQTTTALLMIENIISLLAIPAIFLFDVLAEGYMHYVFVGYFGILITWNLAIITFLMKQLLPMSSAGCFFVALGYIATTVLGPLLIMLAFF